MMRFLKDLGVVFYYPGMESKYADRLEKLLKSAKAYESDRKWDAALTDLHAALKSHDKDFAATNKARGDVWLSIARVHKQNKDFRRAIKAQTEAIYSAENDNSMSSRLRTTLLQSAFRERGILHFDNEDYEAALPDIRRFVELSSNDEKALRLLALVYAKMKRWQESKRADTKADEMASSSRSRSRRSLSPKRQRSPYRRRKSLSRSPPRRHRSPSRSSRTPSRSRMKRSRKPSRNRSRSHKRSPSRRNRSPARKEEDNDAKLPTIRSTSKDVGEWISSLGREFSPYLNTSVDNAFNGEMLWMAVRERDPTLQMELFHGAGINIRAHIVKIMDLLTRVVK
jgi:tetratricopeptide (TPR) repeat protein